MDRPGTVYFDPELDHRSAFYRRDPARLVYFVALDETGGRSNALSGDAHEFRHGTVKRYEKMGPIASTAPPPWSMLPWTSSF